MIWGDLASKVFVSLQSTELFLGCCRKKITAWYFTLRVLCLFMAIVTRHLHWNMDRERELGPPAVLTKKKERDQEHRPATSNGGGGGDGRCIGWALLCQAFWLAPHRAYLIIITSWGRNSYTHLTDEESEDYIICSNAWQMWVWNWICLTVKLSSFLRWEQYHCLSMIAALLFPFKAAPGVCSKQPRLS